MSRRVSVNFLVSHLNSLFLAADQNGLINYLSRTGLIDKFIESISVSNETHLYFKFSTVMFGLCPQTFNDPTTPHLKGFILKLEKFCIFSYTFPRFRNGSQNIDALSRHEDFYAMIILNRSF